MDPYTYNYKSKYNTSMKTITKEKAALNHLVTALELFYNRNYLSSITLAGAAEEIFGRIAKEVTKTNSAKIDSALFEMTLGIENYEGQKNKVRNELKHYDGQDRILFSEKPSRTAMLHLAGAIINFKLINKKMPEEKIIIKFCQEFGLN